jgi:hypothetical protein
LSGRRDAPFHNLSLREAHHISHDGFQPWRPVEVAITFLPPRYRFVTIDGRAVAEDRMPRNTSVANKERFDKIFAEFYEAVAKNLDEDEKLLMHRIAESPDAPDAFAEIKDSATIKRLLWLCVEVRFLAAHFNEFIGNAESALEKAARDERAIAHVEELLKETQAPAVKRLAAYTLPDRPRIKLEREALVSIKDRLAIRTRIAKETIFRFGATRKRHGPKAAEIAAIGWMAEGVQRITKQPNYNLVADLAELVLGCEVTMDRVKSAVGTRQGDWRVPP